MTHEIVSSLDDLLISELRIVEFFSPSFSADSRYRDLARKATIRANVQSNKTKSPKPIVKCYSSLCIDYNHWPFRRDIDPKNVAAESFTLGEFQKLGCEVIWRPFLKTDDNILLLPDRGIAYQFDKEHGALQKVSIDKHIQSLDSKSGYYKEIKGKVVFIQELEAKPYDVDLLVRIKEENSEVSSSQSPVKGSSSAVNTTAVFLHSQCLNDDQLNCGDVIDVSAIVNISGEGVMGTSAPSDLFVEGLGVKFEEKARPEEISKYPPRLRFRDEVLKLLKSERQFSLNPNLVKSKKKTDEWTGWAFKKLQEILKERGLFMQSGDDSFIMTMLHKMVEDKLESSKEEIRS
jgi:hypothetical protein